MRKVRLTMATILLGACFASCNKDNYTATPATSNVSSNSTGGTYTTNANGTTGAVTPGDATTGNSTSTSYGWKWNSAEVYMSNVFIKTVKDGDQAQAQTIELNGRYSILPNAAMLNGPVLTTGTYTRIDVVANMQNSATANALTINGVLGPDGSSLPVVIRIDEPMQLTYNKMNMVIGANERYQIVVRLNTTVLNNTLTTTDADGARLSGGPIEISKRSNVALYNKIMQQLTSIVIIDLVRA